VPTPVGHTLAGITVALVAQRPRYFRPALFAAAVILIANLPDVDFIPGYLLGDAGRFHWRATHSICAALMAGLGTGLLFWKWRRDFWLPALIVTIAWLSHVLLDLLFGPVHGDPFGLQLFWPFSHRRVMLPWSVFIMYPNDAIRENPFTAFLNPRVIPLVARELIVLGPFVVAAFAFSRARARGIIPSGQPRKAAVPPGTAADA
jgi:membrane-bound metal-dependent hydrolase YbcI (DUF457 family)